MCTLCNTLVSVCASISLCVTTCEYMHTDCYASCVCASALPSVAPKPAAMCGRYSSPQSQLRCVLLGLLSEQAPRGPMSVTEQGWSSHTQQKAQHPCDASPAGKDGNAQGTLMSECPQHQLLHFLLASWRGPQSHFIRTPAEQNIPCDQLPLPPEHVFLAQGQEAAAAEPGAGSWAVGHETQSLPEHPPTCRVGERGSPLACHPGMPLGYNSDSSRAPLGKENLLDLQCQCSLRNDLQYRQELC